MIFLLGGGGGGGTQHPCDFVCIELCSRVTFRILCIMQGTIVISYTYVYETHTVQ